MERDCAQDQGERGLSTSMSYTASHSYFEEGIVILNSTSANHGQKTYNIKFTMLTIFNI